MGDEKFLLREVFRWTSISLLVQVFMTVGLWVPKGVFSRKLPNLSLGELFDVDFGLQSIPKFELFSWLPSNELVSAISPTELLIAGGLVALLLNVIRPNKYLALTQTFCFISLICLDYLRMQTWLYIYCTIYLIYAASKFKFISSKEAIVLMRIVASGVWLWSGFLKFNPNFPFGDFNFMMFLMPNKHFPRYAVVICSWLAGLSELLLGLICLMLSLNSAFGTFSSIMSRKVDPNSLKMKFISPILDLIDMSFRVKFRRARIKSGGNLMMEVKDIAWILMPFLGFSMHLLIVVRLLIAQYELSVLPWNVAFFAYTYFLFLLGKPPSSFEENDIPKITFSGTFSRILTALIAFLFIFSPSLCFIGIWDTYWSFGMYTSNDPAMLITLPSELNALTSDDLFIFPNMRRIGATKKLMKTRLDAFSCRIEEPCTNCLIPGEEGPNLSKYVYVINGYNWGFHDTGSSVHPSVKVFEKLGKKICEALNDYPLNFADVRLEIQNVRVYIVEKDNVPYSSVRNGREYKCGKTPTERGKLLLLKENICTWKDGYPYGSNVVS